MRTLCSSIAAVAVLIAPANAETGPAGPKTTTAKESDEIPTVTTLTGITFQRVKLIQRDGDTVRFMHSAGIKTLKLSDLDQSSAKLLGQTDYQNEVKAAKEATKAKAADEKRRNEEMALKRKAVVEALKSKKVKELQDWALLTAIENSSATVETMKKVVGRPPDSQSGPGYFVWWNACWNPTTEKLDNLVLKRETRVVPEISRHPITVHFLVCGEYSVNSLELRQMNWDLEKGLDAKPIEKR